MLEGQRQRREEREAANLKRNEENKVLMVVFILFEKIALIINES